MARTLVLLPALAWHSCADPWFEAASAAAAQFLCDHAGAPELADAHLLQGAIWAACAVLDGAQLELTLAALMAQLVQAPHFNAMPAAEYGLSPLDFAPSPTSACAQLFTQSQMTAHLDHIEQTQSDDGGWPIAFQPSSPAAEWEWRGSITLKHLRILHAYGRI